MFLVHPTLTLENMESAASVVKDCAEKASNKLVSNLISVFFSCTWFSFIFFKFMNNKKSEGRHDQKNKVRYNYRQVFS
ncbi:MAG: hypothetical protein H6681_06575 [Desulfobacteraceae bacterium]|nr:hypothetical protein [Desulfobacteraceae bacterium]